MKFLSDNYHGDLQLDVLTENTESGRKLYLEGPMVMCNSKNRNGRIYDMDTVGIPAVEAYNRDYIQDRRAIGEVEHPEYPFPKLSEAATMIHTPLTWDKSLAVGRAEVLNNPKGQILRSLVEAGYNLGVSTRGLGEVRGDHVRPGYMITAVDTVDRPSGQACYVNAIHESVEWICENGVWRPVSVDGRKADTFIRENSNDEELIRRFKMALNRL
jgi:hypothetical protein